MSIAREVGKVVVKSSNERKDLKYDKGKSSIVCHQVMVATTTSLKLPDHQKFTIFAQIYENQNLRYRKQFKPCYRLEIWCATLDPIPIPCGQLLPYLTQNLLMVPKSLGPAHASYPPGYDPNAQCEYHYGEIGNSI